MLGPTLIRVPIVSYLSGFIIGAGNEPPLIIFAALYNKLLFFTYSFFMNFVVVSMQIYEKKTKHDDDYDDDELE